MFLHIVREALAADTLDHYLKQGKAVVAVVFHSSGVCLQPCIFQIFKEPVVIAAVYVIVQHHVVIHHSHKPRRMVHQHSYGDVLISFVTHGKFGYIFGHGRVDVKQSPFLKLQRRSRAEHLAHRPYCRNGVGLYRSLCGLRPAFLAPCR